MLIFEFLQLFWGISNKYQEIRRSFTSNTYSNECTSLKTKQFWKPKLLCFLKKSLRHAVSIGLASNTVSVCWVGALALAGVHGCARCGCCGLKRPIRLCCFGWSSSRRRSVSSAKKEFSLVLSKWSGVKPMPLDYIICSAKGIFESKLITLCLCLCHLVASSEFRSLELFALLFIVGKDFKVCQICYMKSMVYILRFSIRPIGSLTRDRPTKCNQD